MTVKECAEKMGVSKWAIYTAINEGYGVGKLFKKREGRWWVDARRVTIKSK